MKAEHFIKLLSEIDVQKVAYASLYVKDQLVKLSPEIERLYAEARMLAETKLVKTENKGTYFWRRSKGSMYDDYKLLESLHEELDKIDSAYVELFNRVQKLSNGNVHTLSDIKDKEKVFSPRNRH